MLKLLAVGLRAMFRSRQDLLLENIALRHQLAVALRTNPRPRLTARDRLFWVGLSRIWASGWRPHLQIVQPATVAGWHRKGWRLYWRWRSKSRGGRPRLSPEVRELITEMWRSNRLWGSERIRGELEKLGIFVSNRSIRRYRWVHRPSDGTQQWRTFLINELKGIWAADLFTVQTLTMRTLYVLFFIAHDRRQTVHFKVTASPTAAWVWNQVIEATPWGQHPDYLIHDRDAVYGNDFEVKLAKLGVTGIRTPVRAPRANAIAERLVRTIRQECLDHIIVIEERHLAALLKEYLRFYNEERPHRSLELGTPVAMARTQTGPVVRKPVLGGLHHAYARAA